MKNLMLSPEDKERIDYEIEAKRKSRNKNLDEWATAIVQAVIFISIIIIMAGLFMVVF